MKLSSSIQEKDQSPGFWKIIGRTEVVDNPITATLATTQKQCLRRIQQQAFSQFRRSIFILKTERSRKSKSWQWPTYWCGQTSLNMFRGDMLTEFASNVYFDENLLLDTIANYSFEKLLLTKKNLSDLTTIHFSEKWYPPPPSRLQSHVFC